MMTCERGELREIYSLLGGRLVQLATQKGSASQEDLAAIAALLGRETNL